MSENGNGKRPKTLAIALVTALTALTGTIVTEIMDYLKSQTDERKQEMAYNVSAAYIARLGERVAVLEATRLTDQEVEELFEILEDAIPRARLAECQSREDCGDGHRCLAGQCVPIPSKVPKRPVAVMSDKPEPAPAPPPAKMDEFKLPDYQQLQVQAERGEPWNLEEMSPAGD